jgi:hypothetical protein
MLRGGATLQSVGAVLRHRSLDTTAHYAKVDLPMLQQIGEQDGNDGPGRREASDRTRLKRSPGLKMCLQYDIPQYGRVPLGTPIVRSSLISCFIYDTGRAAVL